MPNSSAPRLSREGEGASAPFTYSIHRGPRLRFWDERRNEIASIDLTRREALGLAGDLLKFLAESEQ